MNTAIVIALEQAWRDSHSEDPANRHEEGGYIVLNPDGSHGVERWKRGELSRILPPPLDASNCYNGKVVVTAFHTHPNPPLDEVGQIWEQGPSESDRRWHARRNLTGFVIGRELVYRIDGASGVAVIGSREEVLSR